MSLTTMRALVERPNTVPSEKRTVRAAPEAVSSASTLLIGSPRWVCPARRFRCGGDARHLVDFSDRHRRRNRSRRSGRDLRSLGKLLFVAYGIVRMSRPCRRLALELHVLAIPPLGRPPGSASTRLGNSGARKPSLGAPAKSGSAGPDACNSPWPGSDPLLDNGHVLWTKTITVGGVPREHRRPSN